MSENQSVIVFRKGDPLHCARSTTSLSVQVYFSSTNKYKYKSVLVRCIPGSPLPGCVDDVSPVESDVDSLVVVVVSDVVVSARAV